MILFYTYKLHTFIPMQVLPGHELLAGDAGARAGARGRPHATPQPHRSSAWTWRPASSHPPPTCGPTGLGARPSPRTSPIVILGRVLPRGYGCMGLQHAPALAHNALEPQAIARRRAFRKATNRFALVCTGLHRFAHNARQAPQQYGEALAGSVWGLGTVSPSALGRQPPPRSTSRPPARAGPRLSHPLGRSHLSAGESPLGSWAYSWRHCPWLLRKRRKQD